MHITEPPAQSVPIKPSTAFPLHLSFPWHLSLQNYFPCHLFLYHQCYLSLSWATFYQHPTFIHNPAPPLISTINSSTSMLLYYSLHSPLHIPSDHPHPSLLNYHSLLHSLQNSTHLFTTLPLTPLSVLHPLSYSIAHYPFHNAKSSPPLSHSYSYHHQSSSLSNSHFYHTLPELHLLISIPHSYHHPHYLYLLSTIPSPLFTIHLHSTSYSLHLHSYLCF